MKKISEEEEVGLPEPRRRQKGAIAGTACDIQPLSDFSKACRTSEDGPTLSARQDSIRYAVQVFPIVNQLIGTVLTSTISVLSGMDGCGKTTAALMLSDYVNSLLHMDVYWTTRRTFVNALSHSGTRKRLLVLDNFLGHTFLDSYDEWKEIIEELNFCTKEVYSTFHVLLISRSSVISDALIQFDAETHLFIKKSSVVNIFIDYRKMFPKLVNVPLQRPNYKYTSAIGYPLCFFLAQYLLPTYRKYLCTYPRFALNRQLYAMITGGNLARSALALLAVTEDYVNVTLLLETSHYTEILQAIGGVRPSAEFTREIVSYYRSTSGLVQVQDEFVSFVNEAVREAALVALSCANVDFMANVCSLKLLGRLAQVTSDVFEGADARRRPALSDVARAAILQRFLREIAAGNFRETLTSPLINHTTFLDEFLEELTEERLNRCLTQRDSHGIYFLFWAGACDTLFSSLLLTFEEMDIFLLRQVLIACCFWGRTDELKLLESYMPLIADDASNPIDALFLSTLSPPDWTKTPFHRQDSPLTTAALRGHESVVDILLGMGCNVNMRGHNGCTALMHFCSRGNVPMVSKLLQVGAKPGTKNLFEMTPLHFAANRPEWTIPVALYVLSDLSARNCLQETPLQLACWNKWRTETLKQFMHGFMDPSEEDVNGKSIYHAASHYGSFQTMKMLKELRRGRPFEDVAQSLLRYIVMKAGREEILGLLLRYLENKSCYIDYEALLSDACLCSDTEMILQLVESPRGRAYTKNRAMWLACKFGNTPAINMLLRLGGDPSYVDEGEKMTCLQAACRAPSSICVQIVAGSSLCDVSTPLLVESLYTALQYGRLQTVKVLCERDRNLKYRHHARSTFLHAAALSDSAEVLDWCLENLSVDLNARNESDMTPFAFACYRGKIRAARWLADRGSDVKVRLSDGSTCLHLAVLHGSEALVQALLTLGPPLISNDDDNHGNTPLLMAFAKGSVKIVDVLGLDQRSVNNRNHRGRGCLDYAMLYNNKELTERCLSFCPEGVDTRLSNGDTPFLSACRKGFTQLAEWLLERGANPYLAGLDSLNAKDVARDASNRRLLQRMASTWPNSDSDEDYDDAQSAYV